MLQNIGCGERQFDSNKFGSMAFRKVGRESRQRQHFVHSQAGPARPSVELPAIHSWLVPVSVVFETSVEPV
jgi:hypothetical protein